MDLRHLRYFATLAQERNFTRAAARLNVSQPPLSQQIKALENELGAPLFVRTSRRVDLTAAGHVFLVHANAILERVEQACAEARAVGAGHLGTLDIGSSSSLLLGPLPQVIAGYRRAFPGVKVALHEMTPAAQLTALRDRRLDVSFSRTPVEDENFTTELAWHDPVVAALPRNHRLLARRKLALKDFAGEEFVMLRLDSSAFAAYLHQCCVGAGFLPRASQYVVESQAMPSLVAAGLGVALVPASLARVHRQGVEYRTLNGAVPRADVHASTRRGDTSATVRNFLEKAREILARK
ncbi:MAG TPA: LysR substrate-binding domain-containing protein [Casimicrobiaceae bacterium]|jgi:DNA-binding transcriptional LysR family regulator|nr:LysR substrate-binding domain-containing protein [Casimicrobiaceae bacterium]